MSRCFAVFGISRRCLLIIDTQIQARYRRPPRDQAIPEGESILPCFALHALLDADVISAISSSPPNSSSESSPSSDLSERLPRTSRLISDSSRPLSVRVVVSRSILPLTYPFFHHSGALQESAEAYLVSLFEDTNLAVSCTRAHRPSHY